MDDWGDAATKVTIQQLEDRVVTLVPDPVSGEQGSSGRMQAYIKLEGKDFNAALVKLGLSRMHTEGDSGRAADYSALQEWLKG